ncbi:putative toxin-antitoxin system toxin component, PIN family [Geitlerinema calcuttense]|uniref:Toxin-antitoxin system toxin component, PIN family n=1 Tax=Geitlerinema calcuttense NRMC-F 0142 TaxID=2922238 RepID=A0ABT7M0T9_9CYAN|nr:putative toxin-antitoxin system toxin component, PIN family [Geitlerinema calcuttense]MDL5057873.1 putative toxin-antitoxin system toxin component, PIN family [Geitlerinema calcuttense NRMC-F 0142]
MVLDTNVLISGLLNPFGTPGKIIRLIGSPDLTLCVDAHILAEYEEVMKRPRFQISPKMIDELMESIRLASEIHPPCHLKIDLPDEEDTPFLAVAIASRAEFLITGNIRHFPKTHRQGVNVVTPAEFIMLSSKPGK